MKPNNSEKWNIPVFYGGQIWPVLLPTTREINWIWCFFQEHLYTVYDPNLDKPTLKIGRLGTEKTDLEFWPCLRSWRRGWSHQGIWAVIWLKHFGRNPLLLCWTPPQKPAGSRHKPCWFWTLFWVTNKQTFKFWSMCNTSSVSSGK